MGRKSRNQKDVGQKHEVSKGQWAENPEIRKTSGKNTKSVKVSGQKIQKLDVGEKHEGEWAKKRDIRKVLEEME